jgi:hypothetical protein
LLCLLTAVRRATSLMQRMKAGARARWRCVVRVWGGVVWEGVGLVWAYCM